LADQLRAHRLELLADPEDELADPRTVFSWSYRSLPPETTWVFRTLSLHPGTEFCLAAAAALIGLPVMEARGALDRLVAVHLLEQTGPRRYRFHDLIREYATERAASDEPADARATATRRLLDWYLQSSYRANRAFNFGTRITVLPSADADLEPLRFGDRSAALTWFQAELPTLVAVAQHAADHGHPAHAEQLQWVLAGPCELTQRLDEWLALATISYRSAESLDAPAKHRAARGLGVVLSYLGRLDESEPYKEEALRHARTAGDAEGIVNALNGLGITRKDRGNWLAGLECWHEALGTARDNGLQSKAAVCLLNIGGEEANNGRYEDAVRHLEEALDIFRELDLPLQQGMALSNLADAYARAGDLRRAVRLCDDAVAVLARTESGTVPFDFAMEMTRIYARAGHRDKARQVLRRTLQMLRGGAHPRLAEAEQLLLELGAVETEQPARTAGPV
ncbi:MAG: tetratricopeptide repeat protein, partial [Micromonosporaceae bacterium]